MVKYLWVHPLFDQFFEQNSLKIFNIFGQKVDFAHIFAPKVGTKNNDFSGVCELFAHFPTFSINYYE